MWAASSRLVASAASRVGFGDASLASGAAGSVDSVYTAATATSSAAARKKGETYARWIRERAAGHALEARREDLDRARRDLEDADADAPRSKKKKSRQEAARSRWRSLFRTKEARDPAALPDPGALPAPKPSSKSPWDTFLSMRGR